MQSMSLPSAITGPPEPHLATQPVGRPATFRSNGEAVLLEDVGDVLRGLEFLERELAEAEDRVVHLLRELGAGLDAFDGALLQFGDPLHLGCVRGSRLRGYLCKDRRGRGEQGGEQAD